jgi:molybdopterin-containing oxidoreductase family membrane subunit
VIVVTLARDFLPSSWSHYTPTIWDWATLAGSFGLFFTLFLLFLKFLPVVSMTEVKGVLPQADPHHHAAHDQSSHAKVTGGQS